MKVNFIKKFQEGGQVEQGQPQGGGAEEQIAQMAQQLAQQLQDPKIIGMLGQALMQIAEGAVQEQAPQGPPVYKRGGKVGEKRLTLIGRK